MRGKLSKKGGRKRTEGLPFVRLGKKPIKSRRTNLAKPAYHRSS